MLALNILPLTGGEKKSFIDLCLVEESPQSSSITSDKKRFYAECVTQAVRGEQQAFRAALIVSVSGKSNCVQEAPPMCTGNRPRMVLSSADNISILINII